MQEAITDDGNCRCRRQTCSYSAQFRDCMRQGSPALFYSEDGVHGSTTLWNDLALFQHRPYQFEYILSDNLVSLFAWMNAIRLHQLRLVVNVNQQKR